MIRSNKRYIKDAILIIFSVLFALFINKIAENIQTSNKKKIALENIKNEIKRNVEVLEIWKDLHFKISEKIQNAVEGKNDSLKLKLLEYNYFNIGELTDGKSLISMMITNTAWETAKSTGIISEFDFATIEKLTGIYLLQQTLVDKTLNNIINLLFSAEANNLKFLDQTLIQLNLHFHELKGQELLLYELYSNIDIQN